MDPDHENSQETQISLEQLLRLKRHEKPGDAFWEKFDRELEKKRLQAMVTRDPWPVRLFHSMLVYFHPTVAVGAASAFALAFLFVFTQSDTSPGAAISPSGLETQVSSQGFNNREASEIPAATISNLASTTRQPAQISIMETDFGVDVIAPTPQTYRFRAYRTDMAPATFQVSEEKTASYLPDSLSLSPFTSSRSF